MKKMFCICSIFFVMALTACDDILPHADKSDSKTTEVVQLDSSTLPYIMNTETIESSNYIEKEYEIAIVNPISSILVPYEEFEFGDYCILLKESVDQVSREQFYTYNFYFLGKNILNKENGSDLFKKVKEKYYKEYVVDITPFENDSFSKEAIKEYYFERNIIMISDDGNRVLCRTFVNNNNSLDTYYWDQVYEVFEKDVLLYAYTQHGVEGHTGVFIPNTDLRGCFIANPTSDKLVYLDFFTHKETTIDDNSSPNMQLKANNSNCVLVKEEIDMTARLEFYSLRDGKKYLEMIFPNLIEVYQFTDNNEILVGFEGQNFHSAMIELHTGKETTIGTMSIDTIISPDGKYVAYRSPNDYECENSEIEQGFYIINLEKNEAVFISIERETRFFEVLGWVKQYNYTEMFWWN